MGDKGFNEELERQADEEKFIFTPMASVDLIAIAGKVFKISTTKDSEAAVWKTVNEPGAQVGMYCCQFSGDYRPSEIADSFGLTHWLA